MTERTIVLTDEDAALLDGLVAAGGYQDAREALHESLLRAERARRKDASREARFLAAIQVGLDDVAAGRVTTFDSAEALTAHFAARRRAVLGTPDR